MQFYEPANLSQLNIVQLNTTNVVIDHFTQNLTFFLQLKFPS